jgi:hypothetical protein
VSQGLTLRLRADTKYLGLSWTLPLCGPVTLSILAFLRPSVLTQRRQCASWGYGENNGAL